MQGNHAEEARNVNENAGTATATTTIITTNSSSNGNNHADKNTDIFLRRYSADTRPFIKFHCDHALVTLNVALAADPQAEDGGQLLVVSGNKVEAISRLQGEAAIHCSDLLHAVSRIRKGTRYSMLIFFGA